MTPVSTSFAYVYIYELLNGIGASSPQDAFAKLHDFWEAYRDLDPSINRYVKTWLRDLVIYHGMDRSLIEADPLLGDVIVYDEALATLLGPASHTPEERFGALSTLSTYRINSSAALQAGAAGHAGRDAGGRRAARRLLSQEPQV